MPDRNKLGEKVPVFWGYGHNGKQGWVAGANHSWEPKAASESESGALSLEAGSEKIVKS